MTQQDKEQLKLEIDHIFESGANEIRIFEMVVNFIDSREEVKVISSKPVLPAGAEWLQREYYCKNFTVKDYERCGDYMKEQRETKDDYIILKVEYNPMKGTCKFVDKVRLRPCR